MDLPQKFDIRRVLIKGKKSYSVSELFAAVPENPKDRDQAEFREAVGFAKILEIWHGHDLSIYAVNEEVSPYKGIDFFLSSEVKSNSKEGFQLVEFEGKYSSVKNTDDFAKWIIDKKFKKGDKRVHLAVNVAPGNRQINLELDVLRELLKGSPFRSIILLGPVPNESSPKKSNYILLGLNSFNTQAIISLENESIISCTGECPYFNPKPEQSGMPKKAALAHSEAKRKK